MQPFSQYHISLRDLKESTWIYPLTLSGPCCFPFPKRRLTVLRQYRTPLREDFYTFPFPSGCKCEPLESNIFFSETPISPLGSHTKPTIGSRARAFGAVSFLVPGKEALDGKYSNQKFRLRGKQEACKWLTTGSPKPDSDSAQARHQMNHTTALRCSWWQGLISRNNPRKATKKNHKGW